MSDGGMKQKKPLQRPPTKQKSKPKKQLNEPRRARTSLQTQKKTPRRKISSIGQSFLDNFIKESKQQIKAKN